MRQIYLDYNATTPISPSVVEAMLPFLNRHYGNPSSFHRMGLAAKESIEDARGRVARLLGADAEEIVFTGCGTESNNLAIKGIMLNSRLDAPGHWIISSLEHAAVSEPAHFLQRLGIDFSVVPCDPDGVVAPQAVAEALRPDTRLVSIMHANNEIGTIQPIAAIARICHQNNVLLHTDAAQSVGKIPVDVDKLEVDLLTISGHKFYGPKGVAALYVRTGVLLEPLLHGADHERGMRGGTLNSAGIVGLGQAASAVVQQLDEQSTSMADLRDQLEQLLTSEIPGCVIHGANADRLSNSDHSACPARLPNTLSIAFPRVSGFQLLNQVPELCASLGTACHGEHDSASPTLVAIGCPRELMEGTIRISVGWYTTPDDIERAGQLLVDAWERLSE